MFGASDHFTLCCAKNKMDNLFPDKKEKAKELRKLRKFVVPASLVDSISHKDSVPDILENVKIASSRWKGIKRAFHFCWKKLLYRNLLICATFYGHLSFIDYILSEMKRQANANEKSSRLFKKNLSMAMCIALFQRKDKVYNFLHKELGTLTEIINPKMIADLQYWCEDEKKFETDRLSGKLSVLHMILQQDDVKKLHISDIPKIQSSIDFKKLFFSCCCLEAEKCALFFLEHTKETFAVEIIAYCINDHYISPLMCAVQFSTLLAEALIKRGAFIDFMDNFNRNALHYAVSHVHWSQMLDMSRDNLGWKSLNHYPLMYDIVTFANSEWQEYRKSCKNFQLFNNMSYIVNLNSPFSDRMVYVANLLENKGITKFFCGWFQAITFDTLQFRATPLLVLLKHLELFLDHVRCMKGSGVEITKGNLQGYIDCCKQLVPKLVGCNSLREVEGQDLKFTWYDSTTKALNEVLACITHYVETSSIFEVKIDEYLKIMDCFLEASIIWLNNLLEPGYTHIVSRDIYFGYSKVFTDCVKALPYFTSLKEKEPEQKSGFPVKTVTMQIVENVEINLTEFFVKVVIALHKHGAFVRDYSEEFEVISQLADRKGTEIFLHKVLYCLNTLPHSAYYKAIGILENETEDENRDANDKKCLRTEFKKMKNSSQPRKLRHICRVLIYDALGRNYTDIDELSELSGLRTVYKKYLLAFSD